MLTEVRHPAQLGYRSTQKEAVRLVGKWINAQSINCPVMRVQALAVWKLEMLAHAANHEDVYRQRGSR